LKRKKTACWVKNVEKAGERRKKGRKREPYIGKRLGLGAAFQSRYWRVWKRFIILKD